VNTPPRKESETGLYAPVWRKINQMLDYMREISVVNGRDVRVSRTMNGTMLLGSAKGKASETETPSWKGEWQKMEDAANLEPEESPRPRHYSTGDMVIRGGEQVIDIAGHPLILAGAVCGTWIARRDMTLGEAPGEPTAIETAAGVFDWDLVARFASPTIVARNQGNKVSIETSPGEASISMTDTALSGSVRIDLTAAQGKSITLRKIRVCQNNVMKNMIILASEAFD
jgi:hypothetical protein